MTTSSLSPSPSSADSAPQSGLRSVREQVLAFFGPQSEEHETKRALTNHFQTFVTAPSLAERLDTWLSLIHWTRLDGNIAIRSKTSGFLLFSSGRACPFFHVRYPTSHISRVAHDD